MSGAGEVGQAKAPQAPKALALRSGATPPEELAKLEKLGAGFEAIFTSTLLGELLKPLQGAGIAGEGPGASVVQGLIETHLADHAAKSGGFGIGRMVVRTLEPMLRERRVSLDELQERMDAARPPAAGADETIEMFGAPGISGAQGTNGEGVR